MPNNTKKFKELVNELDIDENITHKFINTPDRKQFNTIRNSVPLVKNWNMMADLLHLPSTRYGFKYLFVICDLASGAFDIEPMKSTKSEEALKAMKKCFTREYIKEPKYSIQTDRGSEFEKEFHNYLYEHSILHKFTLPGRHKQNSMIESLNRQLARLFNGVMNRKELNTNKVNRNWYDSVNIIRTKLNEIRKRDTITPEELTTYKFPDVDLRKEITVKKKEKGKTVSKKQTVFDEPKFKIGEFVHYRLDTPHNALYQKQNTTAFREGDIRVSKEQREIVDIFYMRDKPYFRYYLEGLPDVSYADWELVR